MCRRQRNTAFHIKLLKNLKREVVVAKNVQVFKEKLDKSGYGDMI